MSIVSYEGVVEKGKIRLKAGVHLPDKAKVYVIVPESVDQTTHIMTPRLRRPKQAADFKMEVSEEPSNAGLRK